ncbi:nuclear transport factor 2 family protein [Lacinutrix jangbogonensis]|uniref:nuclear transport factor 2 family protein n=1 Tax=Lacinutrix jangbogonensis TaxID=1469557 RepID=UPI00053E9FBA|nr:nuclear transport factor 2 family protein [Lacinutrix jangbogonensis]
MSAKEIVKAFYDSDLANDSNIVPKFFHKDCEMHWNSSHGYMVLKYNDIVDFFEGTRKSYNTLRFQRSHLLEDNEFVTSRHTLYAQTIENPDHEVALAHFISIWELKDDKLYRCHEISHQADDKTLESNSFSEIKL